MPCRNAKNCPRECTIEDKEPLWLMPEDAHVSAGWIPCYEHEQVEQVMTATRYETKRVKFPGYVQRQYNGVRCLWDGTCAWTKELNSHKKHVLELLRETCPCPSDWVLDGELLLPKPYSFQDTTSAVKKRSHHSDKLEYVVFDAFNRERSELTFSQRMRLSDSIFAPTQIVRSAKELDDCYEQFLAEGYEGLIYRSDVPYRHGSGGQDLMKRKPHTDSEFLIIDVWEGKGKNKGTPVFRCLRPDETRVIPLSLIDPHTKNTFGCVPEGSYEHKRRLWADRDRLIGKLLTIRYWDTFKSGTPQFPIGVAVRDYE